ncbi:MAG: leucine--tRNA ligase [Candidatus Saccharibacteria bacterium]|nr:leucine--tRNA ligase [Candidatus Saccharibacteria bacterium]
MKRYNPKEIEPKWQQIWRETNVYTANLASDKPKYFAFGMFNYPSGNLHVGHAMNFTISDVKSRFKRQQGFESYHPVGWDSFGLPAENYAIKKGISPQESMAQLIPDYQEKYQKMGWSDDWEKEITTSEPEYYKWTQWIFVKMHEHGLVYQDSRWQWWCTKCQTVLANEQVIDGKCWRHDGKDDLIVEKKEVKQWFFKITEYADELLEAVDALDWTESVKLAQKNWIGKSQGAEVMFEVAGSKETITVFTTRPDTLFGATFMVLAPDHALVREITTPDKLDEVEAYIKATAKKTEVERQASKEKTGVYLGVNAINPINGQEIPVYIADYVLSGYGTGAIMAVPAHDERDNAFAKAFDIPIVQVVDSADNSSVQDFYSGYGIAVHSGPYDGLTSKKAGQKIVDDLANKHLAIQKTNYKMRDWSISRQRYWGAPIPVVNCPDCGPVVLKEDQLPVVLPELTDFKPSGDGRSALARAKDWLITTCPDCGKTAERETDTMDTYVDSSWYMMRYLDPQNQSQIFDSNVANQWMPVNFYNGGDHATAHLLYARFITRFFSKIGLLDNPEPFKQMLYNGKVIAKDGTAFSKTLGNGPDPLEIIEQGYGADALRTYLMFAAPLELGARWDPQGVPGAHRFLSRLWNIVQEYIEAPAVELATDQSKKILLIVHKATKKVTDDIEGNRFNTAIAACMEAVNKLYLLKTELPFGQNNVWLEAFEALAMLVGPFAPHIADELWQLLGHSDSIQRDHWPIVDTQYLQVDTFTLVVQVNGKVRAQLSLASDVTKEQALEAAKADSHVQEFINGKDVKKEIYIPGKLVNLVV